MDTMKPDSEQPNTTETNTPAKNRGGAPLGNKNRTRHGLRASSLPAGCSYIEAQLASFRRYVHELVAARDGGVSIYQEATLQSACRHEQRALLAARWLRVDFDKLNVDQRVSLTRDISNATDARDKCLKALGLDGKPDDALAALYSVTLDDEGQTNG